ncbi:hypothetical protein [Thermococcus sp.]
MGMPRWKKALFAGWILLDFLMIVSISLYETGYTLEGYLPAHGEKALRYSPIIYALPSDRPELVLYTFERSGGVTYYVLWKGENSGKPVVDQLYDYVRRLFYGSAEDIESVTVYPLNRTVTFETYNHERVWATFGVLMCSYDDSVINDCVENRTHVKIYTATWNHAFSLNPQKNTIRVNLTMKPMSPTEYIHYAIFRRMNESIKDAIYRALAVAAVLTALINLAGYYVLVKRGIAERIRLRLKP